MKTLAVLFVSFFCFTQAHAAGQDFFAGYPYKSASWKSKTTVHNSKETVTFEQVVLLKNKKMRTDGKFFNRATNETENQVTIISGNTVYLINPDRKQGMKYSLDSKALPEDALAAPAQCREKARKTGSEKVNGIKCDKYEYTCKSAGREVKVAEFRNDKGFSVKTVSKTGGTVTTVETYELKINVPVPDSKFVPAADIKFMDMEALLKKNMKESMKGRDNKVKDGEGSGQKMMKDLMKKMAGE